VLEPNMAMYHAPSTMKSSVGHEHARIREELVIIKMIIRVLDPDTPITSII
jgi:hypothetical protein